MDNLRVDSSPPGPPAPIRLPKSSRPYRLRLASRGAYLLGTSSQNASSYASSPFSSCRCLSRPLPLVTVALLCILCVSTALCLVRAPQEETRKASTRPFCFRSHITSRSSFSSHSPFFAKTSPAHLRMAKMTFVPLPSSHKPPRESKETTKQIGRAHV